MMGRADNSRILRESARVTVSPEVLRRLDVQDALERHDFGRVFALIRKFGGISYSRIAQACDIKPERVGTLARGKGTIATYEKIAEISDGLRIPGRLVGLASRPWELHDDDALEDPRNSRQDAAVRRRDLLGLSVAGFAGVLGADNYAEGALLPKLGTALPAALRQRTERLRRLDDLLGGGDTFPLYLAEYRRTKGLMASRSLSSTTINELLVILAEQAQQAGWAAFDAGGHGVARQLYEESRSAALQAADDALARNALAFLAYQAVSTDPDKAVAVAEASCAGIDKRVPRTARALLHERRAWAQATAGHAAAADAALDEARDALAEKDDSPQPAWAEWVDERELWIMAGRCWTELRRPLRAVPVLESVLADFDDAHARDKALYSSWLADSYLMAGEVEQAAEVVCSVLTLSSGVSSVRPQQRIAAILSRLLPYGRLPQVAVALDLSRSVQGTSGLATLS